MKRSLTLFLLMIIAVFGVGFAQAQDDAVITPQACAEGGTLTMRVWDENWAVVIQQAIDLWKAEYCPEGDVVLEVVPWGQYWDLLRNNAAAGDLPDIFNISQDRFPFYRDNEAILNMQPYFDAASIDTTLWGSGMVDPYRVEGDLYAAPVNWDTIAIFYNVDMYEAAGLELPTDDWTWDDFAEDARALTNAEADVYGAAVYSEFQAGYPNWIAATGTEPIVDAARTECTLDNEGSLEALNFLNGLYTEGVMPSISTLGGTSADDAFNFWLSQRVAMVSGGSWKLPAAFEQTTFNWDVVQLPRNPETERSRSILHSVGYVAAANTDLPDLAANFIVFLASDEGQRFFAEAGGVAPANPGLQDEWVAAFDSEKNIQAFVNATVDSQGVTIFSELGDVPNELVINIFDLNMPVEEAVSQACATIDEALAGQ
ncbi:MAG: sugar ABC transporter substrate-binding protein [Chloroflexota bacterium]|nr:sugar ABC transporter substrate-binding protein [Chloroflexota bacterium]